jgi:uncharacterized membrane protein YkvA (DUF1232 family)
MLARLGEWARLIKRDVVAIYLAAGDPRVPWHAKALAACVAGYALSPIDLIPDFIPVLGYLDDLLIVPLGVWLVLRMIPPQIMAEHRVTAAAATARPTSAAGAIAIIAIWLLLTALACWLAYRLIA